MIALNLLISLTLYTSDLNQGIPFLSDLEGTSHIECHLGTWLYHLTKGLRQLR